MEIGELLQVINGISPFLQGIPKTGRGEDSGRTIHQGGRKAVDGYCPDRDRAIEFDGIIDRSLPQEIHGGNAGGAADPPACLGAGLVTENGGIKPEVDKGEYQHGQPETTGKGY